MAFDMSRILRASAKIKPGAEIWPTSLSVLTSLCGGVAVNLRQLIVPSSHFVSHALYEGIPIPIVFFSLLFLIFPGLDCVEIPHTKVKPGSIFAYVNSVPNQTVKTI